MKDKETIGNELRDLRGTVASQQRELACLWETLKKIESVSCGDTQIAEDDTGGLRWIWRECRHLPQTLLSWQPSE